MKWGIYALDKSKKSKTMTISVALVENNMQDIWLSMSQEGVESLDSNAVQDLFM